MVARLPESEPRIDPRMRTWRAYQLAEDPLSEVTIASAGAIRENSLKTRIGLTGSALTCASASMTSHQSATLETSDSCQDRSALRARRGISARSVAVASPTRLTSKG